MERIFGSHLFFSNYISYLKFIERRVSEDQWRVGWFKSESNTEIYGLKCDLLFLGHSRHFKFIKPFFFSKIQTIFIYPYSAVAMVFSRDEIDHNFIERVLESVRRYLREKTITTPEGFKWGVDVAYIALVSVKKIPEYVKEYFKDFFESSVKDQYMQAEYPGILGYKRINKAIGMCLVDLAMKTVYYKDDLFSKEAKRLFKPKLYLSEKLKVFLGKVKRSLTGRSITTPI